MNAILIKSVLAVIPISLLFAGAIRVVANERTLASVLQLIGAACLVVVVLTHIFEALQLLPSMNWGAQNSAGHYVDLTSAILGVTLFPVRYVLNAFMRGT